MKSAYVADLQESDSQVGWGSLGKGKMLGCAVCRRIPSARSDAVQRTYYCGRRHQGCGSSSAQLRFLSTVSQHVSSAIFVLLECTAHCLVRVAQQPTQWIARVDLVHLSQPT